MQVGITGASGVLGSYLASLIAKEASCAPVRVNIRNSECGLPRELSTRGNMEVRSGDLLDPHYCNDFVSDLDAVIHCANVGVPLGSDHLAANILPTNSLMAANIIHAAMSSGKTPHLIFTSSAGAVYQQRDDKGAKPFVEDDPCRPTSFYGISKLQSEQSFQLATERRWLDATILRITNLFGARVSDDRMQGLVDVAVGRALKSKPVIVRGSLENIRDYVHISDVAKAILSIVICRERLVGVYNVSSGIGYSVDEVLKMVQRAVGKPVQLDLSANKEARPELPLYAVACSEKLQKAIGWRAQVSLADGIKKLVLNE